MINFKKFYIIDRSLKIENVLLVPVSVWSLPIELNPQSSQEQGQCLLLSH